MKILIVEDEERIGRTLKKGLEQENYVVDLATDGESGYDLAESNTYDLIVLDLMLPKIDGLTICKKLREEKIDVPILVLTAKGQVDDKVAGLESGADDYLTKPFAFEELLARIRALTRRPRNWQKKVLEVDNLTMDLSGKEVYRAGKQIQLSSKEFSLLEFLIRHRGEVMTKETIIERVWEYESNILENTVEVYIKNLRSKIDKPFANSKKLLQTVRGFGYKLG